LYVSWISLLDFLLEKTWISIFCCIEHIYHNLANNEILLLERIHRYVCKYVQGLPKLTRTDKCTTLLGWTSIECYIVLLIRYFHFLDDGNKLVFTKLSTYENRSYFLTIFRMSGIKISVLHYWDGPLLSVISTPKNYYFLVNYVICLPGFYRNKYSLHVYYWPFM
jgi:hypothetical protein